MLLLLNYPCKEEEEKKKKYREREVDRATHSEAERKKERDRTRRKQKKSLFVFDRRQNQTESRARAYFLLKRSNFRSIKTVIVVASLSSESSCWRTWRSSCPWLDERTLSQISKDKEKKEEKRHLRPNKGEKLPPPQTTTRAEEDLLEKETDRRWRHRPRTQTRRKTR